MHQFTFDQAALKHKLLYFYNFEKVLHILITTTYLFTYQQIFSIVDHLDVCQSVHIKISLRETMTHYNNIAIIT